MFLLPTVLPSSANECGKNVKSQIALTFDDGPSEKYTGRILNLLKKYNVRATFFLVGTNVCMAPDIVKRESREGHELGNHTFTHPHMKTQTRPSLEFGCHIQSLRKTPDAFPSSGGNPVGCRSFGVGQPRIQTCAVDNRYYGLGAQICR